MVEDQASFLTAVIEVPEPRDPVPCLFTTARNLHLEHLRPRPRESLDKGPEGMGREEREAAPASCRGGQRARINKGPQDAGSGH